MIINRTNILAVFQNLKTTFMKAFEAGPADWQDTAMRVPSGGSENNYKWMSLFPKMREWIGDKVVKALEAFDYTIKNKSFEATVEVDRDDIEDDSAGVYSTLAKDAGLSAKNWPGELIDDLKNAAFVSFCFDGQYFYDTDHPVGEGVMSNKLTAVLSDANRAAADASIGAAIVMIQTFKDDEGRPLKLMPGMIEVPPALSATAEALYTNDKLADGSGNPYKGKLKPKTNPGLISATAWFVHVTSRPLKPFVFQERKAAHFVSMTSLDADSVFKRKKFLFGAEGRGNAGYGLWQLSAGSTGTG